MTDYITLGAELAAKLSNRAGAVAWGAKDFDNTHRNSNLRRAFGKFCAQVLEERAAPPGVRTPASDQAAVDMANSYDGRGTAWSLSDLGDPLFYMIDSISEQIAANHALRRELSARDERVAELEAGLSEILRMNADGIDNARGLTIQIVNALMPAKVDPFPALTALITFHETGGHEGSGSAETLLAAKAELEKAQSC